mmetsp:Transcript_60967/g.72350  ORF Transcript_60967/g.72350 Transcript_60967/m.72350 type:complete len:159 (-) Transcript_60967:185-661(-)
MKRCLVARRQLLQRLIPMTTTKTAAATTTTVTTATTNQHPPPAHAKDATTTSSQSKTNSPIPTPIPNTPPAQTATNALAPAQSSKRHSSSCQRRTARPSPRDPTPILRSTAHARGLDGASETSGDVSGEFAGAGCGGQYKAMDREVSVDETYCYWTRC